MRTKKVNNEINKYWDISFECTEKGFEGKWVVQVAYKDFSKLAQLLYTYLQKNKLDVKLIKLLK